MKKYQLRRKSMLRRDRQKRKRLELIDLHSGLNPIKSLLFWSFFSQNLLDVITGSLICSFLYLLLVLAQNLLFCVRWDVHDLYLGRRQLHGSISRSKSWNQKQSNIRLFKKNNNKLSLQAEFSGRSIWRVEKKEYNMKEETVQSIKKLMRGESKTSLTAPLGPVVRRLITAYPRVKINPGFFFFYLKAFSRTIFSVIFKSIQSTTCWQKEWLRALSKSQN